MTNTVYGQTGTIPPDRMMAILNSSVLNFFNFHLRELKNLDLNNPGFPEIEVYKRPNSLLGVNPEN